MANIGVIGSGQVGTTLGKQLLKSGNKVKYASRDPTSAKVQKLLQEQPTATADTIPNVLSWSDVVLLATPSFHEDSQIQELAKSLLPGANGKVVIDVTNPCSAWPNLEVRWGKEKSGGEVLAEALPESFVYKAFNTIGVELMDDPEGTKLTGQRLTMMYAGAAEKRGTVEKVITDVGFIPEYCGPIRYARNLEAIAELWIHMSIPGCNGNDPAITWGRAFNFQILKPNKPAS